MYITLAEVEKQFDKWNDIIFNNELPKPHFELTETKSFLGMFSWKKVMGEMTYKIRVSNFFDRPLEGFIDTIVHEMLHYYIRYNGIKDTSSHGKKWKKYAAEISKKYGLTITRTNAPGGGISERVIQKKNEKKTKYEYVFVCKMKNNKYGAGVCPSKNVYKLNPRFKAWKSVEYYRIVKAPWSQTYYLRHLRSVCGVGYITKGEYDELMKNQILDYFYD